MGDDIGEGVYATVLMTSERYTYRPIPSSRPGSHDMNSPSPYAFARWHLLAHSLALPVCISCTCSYAMSIVIAF